MATKARSRAGATAGLLGRLRVWTIALVAAICIGATAAAAHAHVPAAASAPENSPLRIARNFAAFTVGAERSQAAGSPLESAHVYGQLASDRPYSTRGPTTWESTTKEAEREFRTNPDFADYVHRTYKPFVVGSDGKTDNPDLTPEQIKDAHEEWEADGKPRRK